MVLAELETNFSSAFKFVIRNVDIYFYLDTQEFSIYLWVNLAKVRIRRNHGFFKSQDGLYHPSNSTRTFKVSNIAFKCAPTQISSQ